MDFESAFLVLGGALVISLQVAQAEPGPQHLAHVEVDYADTLLGTQAVFAVRACMAEDEVRQTGAKPSTPPAAPFQEVPTQTLDDVIVRVFDASGREISRHVGAHDVCGYARISAAFVNAINSTHQGEQP